jgi:hypothetical protein
VVLANLYGLRGNGGQVFFDALRAQYRLFIDPCSAEANLVLRAIPGRQEFSNLQAFDLTSGSRIRSVHNCNLKQVANKIPTVAVRAGVQRSAT